MMRLPPDLSRLLAPRHIAVVGASDTPGNFGGAAIRFMQKFASPCAIWPVNPRRESVLGLHCFPSAAALPEPADLAILAVPAAAVIDAVRDCAAAGITAGIAWAGGFVEGGEEGRVRQQLLAATCRELGFSLLGPNCIGIIDTHAPMIASFASMLRDFDTLRPGHISMISQSGGLATIGHAMAQLSGQGFRYMISTGNEAVLTEADFVHALADDEATRVIAVYLEGAPDGARFRRSLEHAAEANKPVIVLKAGRTEASAGAAAAHTGALAGEGRVWDAVLRATAAIPAESLEELLDIALYLAASAAPRLPRGRGVAAVTFGGGSGVLSADQCDRVGLQVRPLAAASRTALHEVVPPLASTRNPIDMTPQAYADPKWLQVFPQALDLIAADPTADSVFFQLGPMARGELELADIVGAFRARTEGAVIAAWPLASEAVRAHLLSLGLHAFPEYSRAVRVLGRLAAYAEARADASAPAADERLEFDWSAHVPADATDLVVSEPACHRILAASGLAVAPGRLCANDSEAVAAASAVGYPVALKGISAEVTHRAAAGLLRLGLRNADDVASADRELRATAVAAGTPLDGVYVQGMMPSGLDLLVSAFRDPAFGVMLSVGAGGGLAELIDDVVIVPAPLDAAGAARALGRLRLFHAKPFASRAGAAAVAAYVARFSRLAAGAPWRHFTFEVNPIRWSERSMTAVDGLLLIGPG
jgi:acyl-CoA synthetase (NDP forming)